MDIQTGKYVSVRKDGEMLHRFKVVVCLFSTYQRRGDFRRCGKKSITFANEWAINPSSHLRGSENVNSNGCIQMEDGTATMVLSEMSTKARS